MTVNLELPTGQLALHEIRLPADEDVAVTIGRPTSSSYSAVELVMHDGAGSVYWKWGNSPAIVAGSRCDVFPAVVGSVQIPVPGYGASGNQLMLLHLISAGRPLISLIRR